MTVVRAIVTITTTETVVCVLKTVMVVTLADLHNLGYVQRIASDK